MGKFTVPVQKSGLTKSSLESAEKSPSKARSTKTRNVSFGSGSFDELLTASPRKKPQEGEDVVHIDLSVYTDNASIFREALGSQPLYSIAIRHQSLTFMMKQNFETFMKMSIFEFETLWSVLYQSNNETDNDSVGQEKYLKGFYVCGNMTAVKNFILLLDSFAEHRRDTDQKAHVPASLAFRIQNYTGQELSFTSEEMTHDAHVVLASGIGSIIKLQPPVRNKRILLCVLHCLSQDQVKLVFDGDTWTYRDMFESAGVPGFYVDSDGEEAERGQPGVLYTRAFPPASLANERHTGTLLNFIGRGLAKTVFAIRMVPEMPNPKSELLETFLATLRRDTRGIVLAAPSDPFLRLDLPASSSMLPATVPAPSTMLTATANSDDEEK